MRAQKKAKFHYASWFEAVSKQLRSSSEPASVMKFGFYFPVKQATSLRSLTELITSSLFAKNLCTKMYTLCVIYMIYWTITMTSVTAERSFTTMRRIQTYLRQTTDQQRLRPDITPRGVATGGISVYIPSQNQSLKIILCTDCSRCRSI